MAFIAVVVLLLCFRIIAPILLEDNVKRAKTERREQALRNVKMFLMPYKDIWSNLKLANRNCTLELTKNKVIIGTEKNNNSENVRTFTILFSRVYKIDDLWDKFCNSFNRYTTYDGLLTNCLLFDAEYIEERTGNTIDTVDEVVNASNTKRTLLNPTPLKPVEKIDVNNCSEIELTELPGINIIMAKKLIKKREEIGGFKSIEDVFLFLKLKTHMCTQLRSLAYVTKMKGSLKIEHYKERRVDL